MKIKNKYLITGGCGFIGSSLIQSLISSNDNVVLNLDNFGYPSNLKLHRQLTKNKNYLLRKFDIFKSKNLDEIFNDFKPNIVFHLAAESHVDRSLLSPNNFINTNIIGTYNLLNSSVNYLSKLNSKDKKKFRFIHISTDEVFGDLGCSKKSFIENSNYRPSSPYSASKASSDHLVNSWHRSFDLPTIITNCSNNFGPYQFPEKLIPNVIISAINSKPINVYGNGLNIRDWIYVEDNVEALKLISKKGIIGSRYNIGANNLKKNIELIKMICNELNKQYKSNNISNFEDLIVYVKDRPGHDLKYSVNSFKLRNDLGWRPKNSFNDSIKNTVTWYLKNEKWWKNILYNSYDLSRLGLKD